MRRLQRKRKCSDVLCNEVADAFAKYNSTSSSLTQFDKRLKKASGCKSLVLNGCVKCHKYVFHPREKLKSCPLCKGPRYNSEGNPLEIAYYFPLRSRLKSLLRIAEYRMLLRHEYDRPRNINLMTDVYDAPAWVRFMGPPSNPCHRIGLQFCTDGFQAHTSKNCPRSLKPHQFAVLSLPPAIRWHSKYMITSMLLPQDIKSHSQKKYFNFMAKYDLEKLWDQGVSGVKVKVFGTSMDTPGRADLLG